MRIFMYILCGLIIVGSLLLMLASPVIGIIGVAVGVFLIVWFRKMQNRRTPVIEPAEVIKEEPKTQIEQFFIAGFDYFQKELKSLLDEPNDDYTLSDKSFIEETYERAYEYWPKWVEPKFAREPQNEYDPNAIAVYVDDVKIGYIARKDQMRLKEVATKAKKIELKVYGGRYKETDFELIDDSAKVLKGETPYKAVLEIEKDS